MLPHKKSVLLFYAAVKIEDISKLAFHIFIRQPKSVLESYSRNQDRHISCSLTEICFSNLAQINKLEIIVAI